MNDNHPASQKQGTIMQGGGRADTQIAVKQRVSRRLDAESLSPERQDLALTNKTSDYNNRAFDTQRNKNFNSGKAQAFDIPSILINNLVDENGEIRENVHIPEELLQYYQSQYSKATNPLNKLKSISSTMTSFQSQKSLQKFNHAQKDVSNALKNHVKILNQEIDEIQAPVNVIASKRKIMNETNELQLRGLSENLIKQILQTSSLHSLKELDLEVKKCPYILNKIEQPLVNLPNLLQLSITGHKIQKIENLSFLTQLKYLNLSANEISVIERLESLKNLETLNLSDNKIQSLPFQVFSRLQQLKDLDVSKNDISQLSEVKSLIQNKLLKNLNLQQNPVTRDESYLTFVIYENITWLERFDGQLVDSSFKNPTKNFKRKQNAQKRPKSDTKTQASSRKLLSLNFNLEKQVFNQTKKIQKKDQELIDAMEYVTCLEEELLNIKINSLYNQSAVCSPRQYQSNMYNSEIEPHPYSITERVLQGSALSPKPQSDRKLLFKFPDNKPSQSSMGVINSLLPDSSTRPKSSLVQEDYQLKINEGKETYRDSIFNVQKNLQEAFDDTKKLEKSQSAQQLDKYMLSPNMSNKSPSLIGNRGASVTKLLCKERVTSEQIQEQLNKMSTEMQALVQKTEAIKAKIQYKYEASKQCDYQIKDKMVKVMEISQKVNLQCDNFKNLISHQYLMEGSLHQVIEDRVSFIRKFLNWRIDVLKKKSKLQVISSQISFLSLELNFQKQNTQTSVTLQNEQSSPHFSSLISKDMIQQLGQIINQLQVKETKLQQKLSDLENKIKLQSQFSNQQLLDQSIYDYYSNLQGANQAQKQLLKQSEYDLQKGLKKFAKVESYAASKIQQLENIVKQEQILLIKDYKQILQTMNEKQDSIRKIKDKLNLLREEELQIKITQLSKNLRTSEIEKKKLAQRLILRRNECLMSKQEKEEFDQVKRNIDSLKSQYPDLIVVSTKSTEKQKSENIKVQFKNNKDNAISPSKQQGLIIQEVLLEMRNLVKIVEDLKLKEKQNAFEMRRQSQNFNDLEAYLQSTTMISPSPKIEAIGFGLQDANQQLHLSRNQHQTFNQSNLSGQVMRTFDNNNPLLNTTNTLQLGNKSQILSQTGVFSQQEFDNLKNSNQVLKQQLVESENERDQLQIESINKKEHYESILRNIREQITEKEQKYSQFFKEMQASIIELQKRNNDMILVNSELIKKVCSDTPRGTFDGILQSQARPTQLSHSTTLSDQESQIKRLEWLISMQSGIIEDLVKQKGVLESKQQTSNLRSQHEIERISTSGTIDMRGKKNSVSTFDNRGQLSDNMSERQFQSQDLRLASQLLFMDSKKQSRDAKFGLGSFNKNSNQILATDLTSNTENNMIQHLFEIFQQNYISGQQAQVMHTDAGIDTLQTQGTFSKEQNMSIQPFKRQNSQTSQLNKTSDSQENRSKSKSQSQSLGSLKLPKHQQRKSMTKPQSTNQIKDSISNQRVIVKNAKHFEGLPSIQSQNQVRSPKILDNKLPSEVLSSLPQVGVGSLAQQYQANLDVGSQSSYQNMNFVASFQHQNSMFQLNSSTESAKQKFNDLMNQSSIQLINNTNLLINNDFDQVDQNLPAELFEGKMLQSNSDSSPLDMPTLNFNIGQNDTNLQLQSLLNLTYGNHDSRNRNGHTSTEDGSIKSQGHSNSGYSLNNNVWTVGLNAPPRAVNYPQLQPIMSMNPSYDGLCQVLSGSLEQYDTNAFSQGTQNLGMHHQTQTANSSLQSQPSLVQTFGKKQLRLPPSGIQTQSSLNSFRSINKQNSLKSLQNQRDNYPRDNPGEDRRLDSNRGSVSSMLQDGARNQQLKNPLKRSSQESGNLSSKQASRKNSGIIRSNR